MYAAIERCNMQCMCATGIMTILRYFHKCGSTSLKPVNVLKQLQTATEDSIHVDSFETEVCLHIELKHGEGSATYSHCKFH